MATANEDRLFLVPYDFSAHARAALFAAADLARRLPARIELLHVVQPPAYTYAYPYGEPPPPPVADFEAISGEVMAALRKTIAEAGSAEASLRAEARVVSGSNVAHAICATAEEVAADLIVMGTHGRTGLAHVFLGSVAERTLRGAPCPVLTLRAPEEDR